MARQGDFHISVTEGGDGLVHIGLSGSIDQATQGEMKRKVIPYCEREGVKLILDFRDTMYMNSSSIGALGDFQSRCDAAGGKMVGCRVDKTIMDVLELLGMTSVVKFFDSLDKAKAHLLKG